MTSPELIALPLDAIVVADQVRKDFDEPALLALAETMKSHGVIEPIRVRPGTDGRYVVVVGERRARAARIAGLATLPAIVEPTTLSAEEIFERQMIENVHRQDLNPLEKAQAIAALIKSSGKPAAHVAKRLSLSPAEVSKHLSLLQCSPAIQQAVRAGTVSLSSAYELTKQPDAQRRHALESRLLNGDATRAEVVRSRRTSKDDGSIDGLSRHTFCLDAQRQVQLVAPGLKNVGALIDLLEELLAKLRKSRSITPSTLAKLMREQATAAEPAVG